MDGLYNSEIERHRLRIIDSGDSIPSYDEPNNERERHRLRIIDSGDSTPSYDEPNNERERHRLRIIDSGDSIPSYDEPNNEREKHRLRIIDSGDSTPSFSDSNNQRRNYRMRFINPVFISREEAIRRYGRTIEFNIERNNPFETNRRSTGRGLRILNTYDPVSARSMFMGRPLSSFTPSEIEFLREKSKIEQSSAYERIVNAIISSIPENSSQEEKLRVVFDWFVRNTTYYQDYPKNDDFSAKSEFQEWQSYPPELSHLNYNTKEGAILTGCSVCEGLSLAYKDVVNRLGISCDYVKNGVHGWNVVYKEDREYYIDIAQAVPYKNKSTENIIPRLQTNSNFLVTLGELNKGPYPHNNGRIVELETARVR